MKHPKEQLFDPTASHPDGAPALGEACALTRLRPHLAALPHSEVRRPREATSLLVRDLRARTICWSTVRLEADPGAHRDAVDEAAAALDLAIDAFAEASARLEAQRRASVVAACAHVIRERARAVRSGAVLLVRHALDISREDADRLCGTSDTRRHGAVQAELGHLLEWLPQNLTAIGETPESIAPLLERIANSIDELRKSDPATSRDFEHVVDPDLRDRAWTWATRCAETFALRVNLCFAWDAAISRRFRSPLRRARYEDRLRRARGSHPQSP